MNIWNLIKAQNFQLKKDNGIIYIYLVGALFMGGLFSNFMSSHKMEELTGSAIGILNGEVTMIIVGIMVSLLTARIAGWDFNDKTLNYELLSGHSRTNVYWSRVILSMVWCMVTAVIIMFGPILVFGLINGWGIKADMGGVILHYLLVLFPVFRFVSVCVLLTVIMRNCYMVMIIGYVLYAFVWAFAEMQALITDIRLSVHFTATNITRLVEFRDSGFAYIDGKDEIVFDTALEPKLIIGTIVVSLVVGIVCLLIGYTYFKKSDMD